MKIFVTGATGFVGTAVTKELLDNGHSILGLARSEHSAENLRQLGAGVLLGDLESPEILRYGATESDAVIHLGFMHDFSRFAEACAIDSTAIETLGAAIKDTQKPLVVTAGVAFLNAAGPITIESDRAFPPSDEYPRASEAAAKALYDQGIMTSVIRLPPSVHGVDDRGFIPFLIEIARQKGVSAYVGEGKNTWPAVHVNDAARAFCCAVECSSTGEVYHAVAEQGIAFRHIAEAIAIGLGVPCVSLTVDEARDHFGWFFKFASINQPTSSDRTRAKLGWRPTEVDLLTDLMEANYF